TDIAGCRFIRAGLLNFSGEAYRAWRLAATPSHLDDRYTKYLEVALREVSTVYMDRLQAILLIVRNISFAELESSFN
ncbi:hypothetical protein JMJ78_0008234, partial [Colletotrichum scovillei]